MEKRILELYVTLKECCDNLEVSVKTSQNTLSLSANKKNSLDDSLILEKAICYHYKQVLEHLTQIKSHIASIQYHDEKIRKLYDNKIVEVDDFKRYSYVQQQIKAFSQTNSGNIEDGSQLRPKRIERSAQESFKYLDIWEKMVPENGDDLKLNVTKRPMKSKARKTKKYVSSTFNEFLEEDDNQEENETPKSDILNKITEDIEDEMKTLSFLDNAEDEIPIEDQNNNVKFHDKSLHSSYNSYSISDLLQSFAEDKNLSINDIEEESLSSKPKIVELIVS